MRTTTNRVTFQGATNRPDLKVLLDGEHAGDIKHNGRGFRFIAKDGQDMGFQFVRLSTCKLTIRDYLLSASLPVSEMETNAEHEPPAPRAGERERVILNSDLVVRPMPNTLLKTKYLLTTDDDWPVAEFYREEEAEGIAYEHNQYATLIEQRERLAIALRAAKEHLEYCGYGDSWERECATTSGLPRLIDDALATIEREGV